MAPSPRDREDEDQSGLEAKSADGDNQPVEGEPEILEGLARDIVSRLTTTLFGEDEPTAWRRAGREGQAAGQQGEPSEPEGEPSEPDGGLAAGPAGPDDKVAGPEEGPGQAPVEDEPAPVFAPGPVPRRQRLIGSEHPALLVRGTVRSGRQVRHNGDVVVLGDVNPGGQIVAAGDVVVMGTLRGTVHAGATGDSGSVVAAFRLCPTQLRIASHVARPPEEPGGYPDYPELALVREGVVVVRPLTTGTLVRCGLDDDTAPRQVVG